MKTFFILICSVFSIYSQSGWFVQNTLPQPLLAICFINNSTGIAGNTTALYRTSNGGTNWIPVHTYVNNSACYDIQFPDENTGYAIGTSTVANGKIFKTTNSGLNWTEFIVPGIPSYYSFMNLHFINSNTGFLLSYERKFCKTTNGGLNWVVSDVPGAGWLWALWLINNDTGFVGGQNSPLLKTTNSGTNWTPVSGISSNFDCRIIHFINSNTGFVSVNSDTIVRTTNSGINWSPVKLPAATTWFSMHMLNSGKGFLFGGSGGLQRTTNFGDNWIVSNVPVQGDYRYVFMSSNDTAYGVTLNGYQIKTTTGGVFVGIQPVNNEIPHSFSLSQNYPNPFNPLTNIKFSIAKSSFVKLTIFDINGREVETIVNQNLSAGTYNADWDASKFSSGVYFYRIQAGDFNGFKKMILVK